MDNYQNSYDGNNNVTAEDVNYYGANQQPQGYQSGMTNYQVNTPTYPQNTNYQSQQGVYPNYQSVQPMNNTYSSGNYAPAGNPYSQQMNRPEEVSVLQYLGMMWVMVIPIVGLVLMIVWAFSNDGINRRNYARAILINLAIGIVLSFMTWGLMLAFLTAVLENVR